MYSLSKIKKELIKSTEQNLDKEFVAAACLINEEGVAQHVGLVIHSKEGYFLFHYTGEEVLFEDGKVEEWYFHKSIEFIYPEFCGTFLGHCKKIAQNANPKYGYFYNGSFYDSNGIYYSENQIPEFMTCVGFCINVIKGFIEADEYFEYNDWTSQTVSQHYLDSNVIRIQRIAPHVTKSLICENSRRIMPSEFIAAAFIKKIPIRKSDIDLIINDLEKVIYDKKVIA